MATGKKERVLLIHGDQPLLVEEELKKVLERATSEVELEFNLDVFRLGEDALQDALTAAETLPFGSGWRYVVVKEAQKITPAEIKVLDRFLDDPPENATLILVAVGLKRNSALLRTFREKGKVREAVIARREIPIWLRERFRVRGLRVDGKALSHLQEMVGEDLMALESAVEKIALFHQGDRKVELDEVVALVSPSAEKAVYELTERVMVGDADQALKILRRLLQQGEDPSHILYALSRHILRLLRYRALREEGRTDHEIARYLNIPASMEWVVGSRLRPQSSRLGEEGFREAIRCLVAAERDLKTGRLEPEDALVRAVVVLSERFRPGKRKEAGDIDIYT